MAFLYSIFSTALCALLIVRTCLEPELVTDLGQKANQFLNQTVTYTRLEGGLLRISPCLILIAQAWALHNEKLCNLEHLWYIRYFNPQLRSTNDNGRPEGHGGHILNSEHWSRQVDAGPTPPSFSPKAPWWCTQDTLGSPKSTSWSLSSIDSSHPYRSWRSWFLLYCVTWAYFIKGATTRLTFPFSLPTCLPHTQPQHQSYLPRSTALQRDYCLPMLSFTSWNPTSYREDRKSWPTTFLKLTSSFFLKPWPSAAGIKKRKGPKPLKRWQCPAWWVLHEVFFFGVNYQLTTQY